MNDHVENSASRAIEGFGATELQVQTETAAIAIAAAEKAAIEARYVLAIKRPRDWDTVRIRLLKECKRPGFADAAIYKKPVGKKDGVEQFIEGLSVRFAEAALRHVSNFYSSAKSIYDDPHKSITRVTVMDLETNATIEQDITIAKTVERRYLKKGQRPISQRVNSYGEPVFVVEATDDEVLNKTNAQISKALRNGVLRLLPGDVQDECEAACRTTQADRDKADPEGERKKIFDGFAAIGVEPSDLKGYLGHSNQLSPSELGELRAIYAAIRAQETTWTEVYLAKHPKTGSASSDEDDKAKTGAKAKTEEVLEKHRQKAAAKAKAGKTDSKSEPVDTVGQTVPDDIDRGDDPDNY
jgi:hypothetical protein